MIVFLFRWWRRVRTHVPKTTFATDAVFCERTKKNTTNPGRSRRRFTLNNGNRLTMNNTGIVSGDDGVYHVVLNTDRTEEINAFHSADKLIARVKEHVERHSGDPANHTITVCRGSFGHTESVKGLLESLEVLGCGIKEISSGDALGAYYLSTGKRDDDTALVYWDDTVAYSFIMQGALFSFGVADSFGRQRFILNDSLDTEPLADILSVDRIRQNFTANNLSESDISKISADFLRAGMPEDHPFHRLHEILIYSISNINYSFDPARMVFCGRRFQTLSDNEFNELWAIPGKKRIIGDTVKIDYVRLNLPADWKIKGACHFKTL